jgi:RND family efflux transporter MFP subunit
MKQISLSVAALLLLILSVAWMAGAFDDKLPPGTLDAAAVDLSSRSVYTVQREERQLFETVAGSLEAKQSTIVSARIMARIDKVLVRGGDVVEQDKLLITLDKEDLRSRVSKAQANVDAIKAQLDDANTQLARARQLHTKGVVSTAQLDTLEAQASALSAQLEAAKQQLAEAKTTADYAEIRSPIAGRIVDRFAEPGDIAQPGARLLSIYNPSTLRIEASVREQLAVNLKVEDQIVARIPSANKELDAFIEEIVPAAQTGSRTLLVKARIASVEGLYSGLYAELLIPSKVERPILIPQNLVVRVGQLDVVWLVQGEQLERRFIRTGKRYADGMVEVVAGLKEGDSITAKE